MEKEKYIKKITWARNVIVPLFILSLAAGAAQFLPLLFGADAEPTAILAVILAIHLLAFVLGVIYLLGFWAMADQYGQKAIKAGAGIIIASEIVGLVMTLIPFLGEAAQSLTVWIAGVAIALIIASAAGYIVLGVGLRKLGPQVGPRARLVGLLNLLGGIALATIILAVVAVVLFVISYIMSFKLFNDELKKSGVAFN